MGHLQIQRMFPNGVKIAQVLNVALDRYLRNPLEV